MLIEIPQLLSAEEVATIRAIMAAAEMVDGRATAGDMAARLKHNLHPPEGSPAAR